MIKGARRITINLGLSICILINNYFKIFCYQAENYMFKIVFSCIHC